MSNLLGLIKSKVPSTKEEWHTFLTRDIYRYIHVPYIPALHRPGWLLRYFVGPYDKLYFDK